MKEVKRAKWMLWKQVQKKKKNILSDFLWHTAKHSNPKVCIIMRIWETAWNLIGIGYIRSMTPNIKRFPVWIFLDASSFSASFLSPAPPVTGAYISIQGKKHSR